MSEAVTAASVMVCDVCRAPIDHVKSAMLFWGTDGYNGPVTALTLAHKACDKRPGTPDRLSLSAEPATPKTERPERCPPRPLGQLGGAQSLGARRPLASSAPAPSLQTAPPALYTDQRSGAAKCLKSRQPERWDTSATVPASAEPAEFPGQTAHCALDYLSCARLADRRDAPANLGNPVPRPATGAS